MMRRLRAGTPDFQQSLDALLGTLREEIARLDIVIIICFEIHEDAITLQQAGFHARRGDMKTTDAVVRHRQAEQEGQPETEDQTEPP